MDTLLTIGKVISFILAYVAVVIGGGWLTAQLFIFHFEEMDRINREEKERESDGNR